MSAREPPLFLKLEKAACPGVSRNNKPGMVIFWFNVFNKEPQIFSMFFKGMLYDFSVCVIAPGSCFRIVVSLIRSRIDDLP